MKHFLASPDGLDTYNRECGSSVKTFAGEKNGCDSGELLENDVRVCICDTDNCNGANTVQLSLCTILMTTLLAY